MTLWLLRVVWRLRLRGLEAFLECSRKLWKAACSGELGVQEGLSTAMSSAWPPRLPQSFSMKPPAPATSTSPNFKLLGRLGPQEELDKGTRRVQRQYLVVIWVGRC